jgi:hypothetical protein
VIALPLTIDLTRWFQRCRCPVIEKSPQRQSLRCRGRVGVLSATGVTQDAHCVCSRLSVPSLSTVRVAAGWQQPGQAVVQLVRRMHTAGGIQLCQQGVNAGLLQLPDRRAGERRGC